MLALNAILESADSMRWLAVLLDVTVKGLLIIAAAAGASLLLRRRSAAVRHLVWAMAAASLLLLPVLSVALPKLQAPILPTWAADVVEGKPAVSEPTESQPEAPAADTGRDFAAAPVESLTDSGFDPLPPPTEPHIPEQAKPVEPTEEASWEMPSATAAEDTTPTHAPLPPHWSAWVLLAWVVGVAVIAFPLLIGTVTVFWKARRAKRITAGPWASLLKELRGKLGINRPVTLLQSDSSAIPATWGSWRPVILLPVEADGWCDQRRRIVLLHELAHVKRRDCLTQLIGQLACTLYWFNPLVWLAARMLRIERERACDDLVLNAGLKPSDYAGHLLDIVRSLRSARCPSLAAVAMARKSQFEHRLLAILDAKRNRRTITRIGAMIVALLVIGLVIPISIIKATAGNKAPTAEETTTQPAEEQAKTGSSRQRTERVLAHILGLKTPSPTVKYGVAELVMPLDDLDDIDQALYPMFNIGLITSIRTRPNQFNIGFNALSRWRDKVAAEAAGSPEVKAFLKSDATTGPACNRAIVNLKPDDPNATRLAFLLGLVGNRDSVPLLINLLAKTEKKPGKPRLRNRQADVTCMMATRSLWLLSGRWFNKTSADWTKWWQVVQGEFVPARDRGKVRVTGTQVQSLISKIATKDNELVRERLVVLGLNALPHLLKAMAPAPKDLKYRLIWVIDELGRSAKVPRDVRRNYFIRRLSSEKLYSPIGKKAHQRALADQTLVDSFQTAVEVTRRRLATRAGYPYAIGWFAEGSAKIRTILHSKKAGIPAAVPVIIKGLDDQQILVQYTAIKLACMLATVDKANPVEVIEALEKRWHEVSDEQLRYAMVAALTKFDTPAVRHAVRKGLSSDRECIVRDCAVLAQRIRWMLGKDQREIRSRLVELTEHPTDRIREITVYSLNVRAPELLRPHLDRLSKDKSQIIRRYCPWVIAQLKDPAHTKLLVRLASDDDTKVRRSALQAMGHATFRKAIAANPAHLGLLIRFALDEDFYVRQYALQLIGHARPRKNLPAASRGATIKDTELWEALQTICNAIGPEAMVVAVEKAGKSNNFADRLCSIVSQLTRKRSGDPEKVITWWWQFRLDAPVIKRVDLDAKQLKTLWDKLTGKESLKAYQATRRMAGGGERVVVFLAEKLKPVSADAGHIKTLIDQLNSSKYAVRQKAQEELAQIGHPCWSALRNVLESKPSLEARARIEKLLKARTRPYRSTPEARRTVRAVRVLELIATERAVKVLKDLAQGHARAFITGQAKAALNRMERRRGSGRGKPATRLEKSEAVADDISRLLTRFQSEKDRAKRERILYDLTEGRKPGVTDKKRIGNALLKIARTSENTDARWYSIRGLGYLKYREATPFLVECLRDQHRYVRANAARALGEIKAKSASAQLISLLGREKDGGVVEQTSLALCKLEAKEAVGALKKAAGHANHQTRCWVLQAIGKLGAEKDVPFLADFLDDTFPGVPHTAARAIERITGEDFGFPKLSGPVNRKPAINRARQWWEQNKNRLKKQNPPATQPEEESAQFLEARIENLIVQLGSDKYKQRKAAQEKLIQIGRPAVAALKKAMKHKEPEIASRAAHALNQISKRLKARRVRLRTAAKDAVAKNNHVAAIRYYKALMVLPEPPLRDCRPAVRFFETRRDWANLALAQEATSRSMKRVIETPVEKFIRPGERLPEKPVREGGPWVWVQTNLDGVWSKGKGTAENWLPWLKRKQKEMVRDRFYLLLKLGRLYRDKLDQPKKAAGAFAESLREIPFYTEPLDRLIARTWPIRSGKQKEMWGIMGSSYVETMHKLSGVQEQAGDLNAAIETKTRVVLGRFILGWNYRSGLVNRSTRELWALIQKLPADAPLPPLFWFNVLSPERDTIIFDLSKPKAKPDASDIYDLNIVARPGRVFDTLEVTADMESTGGYGEVNCYTVFTKVTTLARIQWHKDKRKGRERMTKTFKVLKGAGVIRFYTWPRDHKGFQVHKITVKATFKPKAERPTNPPTTQPAGKVSVEERLKRLWVALGSTDPKEAAKAVKAMVALGDRAVAFLTERFEPTPADAGRVKGLVAKLDDARYAVRKKAHDELMLLGRAALPALKEALKQPKLSVEARARIKDVGKSLKSRTRPALGTAQARRLEGVVEVLAEIGGARTKGMLAGLAKDGWFPWSKSVNGLQCRLLVVRQQPTPTQRVVNGTMQRVIVLADHLVLELRNVSNKPIYVPVYHDWLPILKIAIKGYPELRSTTTFGGAVETLHLLKPGEVFRRQLRGTGGANYIIGWGRRNHRGSIQFDPAGKTYEISAVLRPLKQGRYVPQPGQPKVKLWTGRLTTNPVTLRLSARPGGRHWPPAPDAATTKPVTVSTVERAVAYAWGFPSERVPSAGKMFLDLDTGRYGDFKTLPNSEAIRKAGVDIYYERVPHGKNIRLITSNMQVQPLLEDTGFNTDLRMVQRTLELGSPYALLVSTAQPVAFRTRDGGMGILQILGPTKDYKGLKIRYKLLKTTQPGSEKYLRDAAKRLTDIVGGQWTIRKKERAPGVGPEISSGGSFRRNGVVVPYWVLAFSLDDRGKAKLKDFQEHCNARVEVLGSNDRLTVLGPRNHLPEITRKILRTLGIAETATQPAGKVVKGLRVSIRAEKKRFGKGQPILIHWKIENVGKVDRTIIWHKLHYSPVLFDIAHKGGKKYLNRSDYRRLVTGALPSPPEKIVLRPGRSKEATFDLRYFMGTTLTGTLKVTGLYAPKAPQTLAAYYIGRPKYKDAVSDRIASNEIEIVIAEPATQPAGADRHVGRLGKQWYMERVKTISGESLDQLIAHVANIDDMHFAATASSDRYYSQGEPESEARILILLFRVRRILEMGRKEPAPVVKALQKTFRRNLAEWPAIHRAALKCHEQYADRAMFGDLPKPILAHNLARMQAAVATYVLAELGDHASLPLLLEGYEKQVKWIDAIPVKKYRWTPQCPVPPPLTLFAMHRLISTLPKSKIPASAAAEYDRYMAWSAKHVPKPIRFTGPRGLPDDPPKMVLYKWPTRWTEGKNMQKYPAAPYLNKRTRQWLALMKPVIKKTFAQPPPATQPGAESAQVLKERIAKLITQLGSKKYKEREQAQEALVRIGIPALTALQAATTDKNLERAQRAKTILREIKKRMTRIALYIVSDPTVLSLKAMKLPIAEMKLRDEPFLTDKDFASYDWDRNRFLLTAGAKARLPRLPPARGMPFVIVVGGKRWYLGAFKASVDSVIVPCVQICYTSPGMFDNAIPTPKVNPRTDLRIRKALELLRGWGEAREGLCCRLVRPDKPIAAGTAPMITVEVRNTTAKPIIWEGCLNNTSLMVQVPGTNWDGWNIPKFKVRTARGDELPDGPYRIAAGGKLTLITRLPWKRLKPGRYQVNCKMTRQNPLSNTYWIGEDMQCRPVVFAVADKNGAVPDAAPTNWSAGKWGQAVEGMQIRLSMGGKFLNPGKVSHFSVDVRNYGKRKMNLTFARVMGISRIPSVSMEIEVDGVWYRSTQKSAGKARPMPFGPGNRYAGLWFLPNTPSNRWRSKDGTVLTFGPGKHVIRVAVTVSPAVPGKGRPVRLVSNPIRPLPRPLPADKLPEHKKTRPATQPDKKNKPSVSGRVLDKPGGKGAAGVMITLWHAGDGKTRKTRTDKDGSYSFADVKPSRYHYVLRIADLSPGVWAEGVVVNVLDKDIRADDLCLTLPQSISGTVRDADTSRPVTGAIINFSTADRNRAAVKTDAKGTFCLYVIPRKVGLYCKGTPYRYYPRRERPEKTVMVAAGEHITGIDFAVRSGPKFTGRVVYPDGKPARRVDVNVQVNWSGSGSGGGTHIDSNGTGKTLPLRTDNDGKFVGYMRRPIVRDWQEKIKLKAVAWLADRSMGGVVRDKTDTSTHRLDPIKIILGKAGSATIRVVDSAGKPIENAKITGSDIQRNYNPHFGGPVKYLGDGKYRMTHLIPGLDYYMSASARAYRARFSNRKKFVLAPGQDYDAGTLVLQRWSRKDIPDLLRWLKSNNPIKVQTVEEGLCTLGPDAADAAPAVILRKSKYEHVRLAVVRILGSLGNPEAIPALKAALKDESPKVRKAAAAAVKKIQKAHKDVPATQPAEKNKPSVSGRVLDKPGGKGVAGATVKLVSHWTHQARKITTDKAGNYGFSGVGPGPHTLRMDNRPAGVWTEGMIVYVVDDPQRYQAGKTRLVWKSSSGGSSYLADAQAEELAACGDGLLKMVLLAAAQRIAEPKARIVANDLRHREPTVKADFPSSIVTEDAIRLTQK